MQLFWSIFELEDFSALLCFSVLLLLIFLSIVAAVEPTGLISDKVVTYFLKRLTKADKRRRMLTRPKRIFLVRHGESASNVDPSTCATVPDNKIPLTERGIEQARSVGETLRELIGNEKVLFYVSPYKRSRQTYDMIAQSFEGCLVRHREDPRLRQQEWANFQDPNALPRLKRQRREIGAFYYRFPEGESGGDVYDRVSSFIETLFREAERKELEDNVIIISHGLTIRLFLMRYFHWSVETFHSLWNFDNCEFCELIRSEDGKYKLKANIRCNDL
eukprot:GCRY01005112.1.p1 GENE.GCRY01005112.1~~GCRY01005112.1.p1  ORF type:complete len:275 (-),score=38.61 GCRY01005112.1:285-1109(-)